MAISNRTAVRRPSQKRKAWRSFPEKRLVSRISLFEEMDTEAILARHPQVCVVDEFPHTNVPGSERAKRWEDVEVLLAAGIDVLTTMNIQHLESLNDQVWQISGIRVRETVPDWVVQQADEVVMVDLTPRALLTGFSEESSTSARRPSALCRTSFVNRRWLRCGNLLSGKPPTKWSIVSEMTDVATSTTGAVSVRPAKTPQDSGLGDSNPKTAMVIRRAKRVSDFLGAECFAVAVQRHGRSERPCRKPDREALERHLNFARNLHIETRILEGDDVASTLVDFGRRNQVTQIFLTRPAGRAWSPALSRDPAQRIIGLAKDMHDRHRLRSRASGPRVNPCRQETSATAFSDLRCFCLSAIASS